MRCGKVGFEHMSCLGYFDCALAGRYACGCNCAPHFRSHTFASAQVCVVCRFDTCVGRLLFGL